MAWSIILHQLSDEPLKKQTKNFLDLLVLFRPKSALLVIEVVVDQLFLIQIHVCQEPLHKAAMKAKVPGLLTFDDRAQLMGITCQDQLTIGFQVLGPDLGDGCFSSLSSLINKHVRGFQRTTLQFPQLLKLVQRATNYFQRSQFFTRQFFNLLNCNRTYTGI